MEQRSLTSPFPAHWTVRQARDAYLEENGFPLAGYDDKWTDASFLGIRFKVPNTRRHRVGIMLHDLHHIATGFGTDLVGEGEVSVWELRGLLALDPYVATLVLTGTMLGVLMAPRRALAALRAPGAALFGDHPHGPQYEEQYAALLELTVGELRTKLGLPANGLARAPRGLHAYAPRQGGVGAAAPAR